jgi:hypothetical protein
MRGQRLNEASEITRAGQSFVDEAICPDCGGHGIHPVGPASGMDSADGMTPCQRSRHWAGA